MASLSTAFPTYNTDFQFKIQKVQITEKTLGLRMNRATTDNIGARVLLVKSGGHSHKAGVMPGSLIVSVNDVNCATKTYPEIIHCLKTAKRPLNMLLSVPRSPSEQLTQLSKACRQSFLSIFSVVLGNLSSINHWEEVNDATVKSSATTSTTTTSTTTSTTSYSHVLLSQTSGMFGFDDEETMSFVPLLSFSDTVQSMKKLCLGFLPHLGINMQEKCQIIISSLTLHLLQCECYDARARCVWRNVSEIIGFSSAWFDQEEQYLAIRVQTEIDLMKESSSSSSKNTTDALEKVQSSNTSTWSKMKKFGQIAGAVTLGTTALILTAGVAAPAVAGGIGAVAAGLGVGGATAGLVTFLGSSGGIVVLTSVLGTAGGGITGFKMKKRLDEVDDFEFEELHDSMKERKETKETKEEGETKTTAATTSSSSLSSSLPSKPVPHMSTIICISGWLKDVKKNEEKDTSIQQWQHVFPDLRKTTKNDTSEATETTEATDFKNIGLSKYAQHIVLNWEREELLALGKAMGSLATETALQYGASEVAKRTFLASIMTALAWPATLISLANYIDNSWSVACARADKAGIILAEVLESRIHGNQPVTLIGYSTGARVIYSALTHMTQKGIVENVVLIGAPVSNDIEGWKKIRSVVTNRIINGYSSKDWALRLLYRANGDGLGCCGLNPIQKGTELLSIEQYDTKQAHFRLRDSIGEVLHKVVGVPVVKK